VTEETESDPDQSDIKIPEDEQAVIDMLGDDATEQEKNLAIAQAKLIGDL
jgi:hypothetical protein